MTTGSFRTEVPTMDVASSHVFEVNEQVQSQLRDLLNRLEPLMGTWQGAASVSFHALKQRWHDNATSLNEALRGIGDGLVKNRDTYASTEEANTEGFTTVAANLD